jgi:hypothetical protein
LNGLAVGGLTPDPYSDRAPFGRGRLLSAAQVCAVSAKEGSAGNRFSLDGFRCALCGKAVRFSQMTLFLAELVVKRIDWGEDVKARSILTSRELQFVMLVPGGHQNEGQPLLGVTAGIVHDCFSSIICSRGLWLLQTTLALARRSLL